MAALAGQRYAISLPILGNDEKKKKKITVTEFLMLGRPLLPHTLPTIHVSSGTAAVDPSCPAF